MTFLQPHTLFWLLGCALLLALSVFAAGLAARRRIALLGPQAARLAPRFSRGRRMLRDALAVLAVGCCVVALAGPQLGDYLREVRERGVELIVVLDTSRSMLARDLKPSRLERARREVRGLLDRLHGDRIGLVTFAGDARQICPLTSDPDAFRLFLDDVDTASSTTGGTAVGEGLERALDSFDPQVTGARVIVLLSDGEDHDSDPAPTEVAYRAKAAGIPIHVVSFGTAEGAEIPIVAQGGGLATVRDENDQPVISRPDETLLSDIANVANGSFLSAARSPFPLDEIWDKRISQMEGVTRSSSTRREGVNRYQWAVVAALALLALRALVSDGRRPGSRAAEDGTVSA